MPEPLSLALINDHPIVVEGLRALLEARPELHVVELDLRVEPEEPVDVALLDTFAIAEPLPDAVRGSLAKPNVSHVVVFTWHADERATREALDAGASGVLSKSLGSDELASALRRVAAGDIVVETGARVADDAAAEGENRTGHDWPGREHGLSQREAEMISLICQGHSNAEICSRLYLSINSVKTYIRTAYAKIGVQTRAQAVIWGMDHGLRPRPDRQALG